MTDKLKPEEQNYKSYTLGVFISSLISILSVVLFLRTGMLVGDLGFNTTFLIMIGSSLIALITALSISATATNARVGGGGAYLMFSRSFGVQIGAAIGLVLFFTQALQISFFVFAFAESVQLWLPNIPLPVTGTVVLTVMTALTYRGININLKFQALILALIITCIGFFLFDCIGKNADSLISPEPQFSYWHYFALFFPSMTGMLSGLSVPYEHNKAPRYLALGIIGAIVVGTAIYIGTAYFLAVIPVDQLKSNMMIFADVIKPQPLALAALWSALLFGTINSLASTPRILQALAQDRAVPAAFGTGFGEQNLPPLATIFTFFIALGAVWLGNVNTIAVFVTLLFLTTYGLLNLTAGVEGLLGTPSWRPKFKVPWMISLVGGFSCVAIIFLIGWWRGYIPLVLSFVAYLVLQKRNIGNHWSDIRYSVLNLFGQVIAHKIKSCPASAQSWRPHLLALAGFPTSRWHLVKLAHGFTHGKGLLTVANIVNQEESDKIFDIRKSMQDILEQNDIPALAEVGIYDNPYAGIKALAQNYGLGVFGPNTIIIDEPEPEQIPLFADLAKLLVAHKRNLIVVKNFDHPPKPTKDSHVHVWLGRNEQNAGFMLALAYMLHTSPEWHDARITIKRLVESREEQIEMNKKLKTFIRKGRLGIQHSSTIKIPHESAMEAIEFGAQDADLTFIGIGMPRPTETPQEYADYLRRHIDSTKKIPRLVMVAALQNVPFKEIFE